MAEVYHQRHPERTVLYRVLFHYFERFLEEYEHRFEKEYGYLRPVIITKMSREVNIEGIVQSTGINLPNIEKTLYSYFSALTGWIFTAFIDWRATVIPATKTETSAAPI